MDEREQVEANIRAQYQEQIQESRRMETQVVMLKRKSETLLKERDRAHAEVQAVLVHKSKLENVCRQLQKQNKEIKAECETRAKEDEDQRGSLSAKFQQTIEEIEVKIPQHDSDKEMLLQERKVLEDRIANLEEQMQLRDQHYAQQLKTKDLHIKLSSTRLKQQQGILEQEEYRRQKYKERIDDQLEGERQLKMQLDNYCSKFEHFQSSLDNSNSVFENFKREMRKMADRVIGLERDNGLLQTKCDRVEKSVKEVTEERAGQPKRQQQLETQNAKLQSLCKVLQAEMSRLEEQLTAKGLTVPKLEDLLEEEEEEEEAEASPPAEPPVRPPEAAPVEF